MSKDTVVQEGHLVEIPKEVTEALSKSMKNSSFFDSIINVNGSNYIERSKFEAYKKLLKILKRNR